MNHGFQARAMRITICLGLTACLLSAFASAAEPLERPTHAHAHLRRPVAAGLLEGGRLIATANQRSGSVSLIDLKAGKAVAELPVGKSLSSLAVLPGGKHILVTDEERHELIALSCQGNKLAVEARLTTTPYPARVAVSADGRRATVAGLWSRKLQVIDVTSLESPSGPPRLAVLHSVRLPFNPRLQLMLPDSTRVLVADAFGGGLAVVDYESGKLVVVHDSFIRDPKGSAPKMHNLRGLALSANGKQLLVAHQILDQKQPVTELAISQNVLMRNVVRRIPLGPLLDSKPLPRDAGSIVRLDDGWIHGSADPSGLAVLGDKGLAVALAGNNMVSVVDANGKVERRINVGARPLAMLREPASGDLIVVNMFSDSVSVVDPTGQKIQREIPLGPLPNLTSRDRGEMLFYDGTLSVHGWMSCHSCHTDGHTNGLLADTSGDNSFGAPKRTLTLLGVAHTDRWAWNGEVPNLQAQIRKSLGATMHSGWFSPESVSDLADYLHTLSPPPPLEPARDEPADKEQLVRGGKLFSERGCVKCHAPDHNYTSPATYDVGLVDEKGHKKFNPPSLRGVSQGRRFFHDNRATSLEDVFSVHGHGLEDTLSPRDLADLLRYLRAL